MAGYSLFQGRTDVALLGSMLLGVSNHKRALLSCEPESAPGGTHAGFFISRCGLLLAYQEEGCRCLFSKFAALVRRNGKTEIANCKPIINLRREKRHSFFNKSPAVLARSDIRPQHWIKIRENRLSAGSKVYSISFLNGIRHVTQGEVVRYRSETNGIDSVWATTRVYHGSCGGALVDENGLLVGFGAKTETNQSSDPREWERKFEVGIFECTVCLADILEVDKYRSRGRSVATAHKALLHGGIAIASAGTALLVANDAQHTMKEKLHNFQARVEAPSARIDESATGTQNPNRSVSRRQKEQSSHITLKRKVHRVKKAAK